MHILVEKIKRHSRVGVGHTFNLALGRQVDLYEFEISLADRVSSRTSKATLRNPVSKQANKQTNKQTNNNW